MKKVITGFAVFLGFMVICTLISKSVYAYRLPVVSTCEPESKYIEHKVQAEGIVEAGGEKTVTCLPGLRIDSVLVHVGEKVEEGDALFQVDLADIKKLMEEKQNEISRVSFQISAILENQAAREQKRELELARAREDYDTTSRLQDTQVGRAMESYVQAENDLEENGGDEELKDALQSAAYGEADSKAARDEAVKQAQRKVEDILADIRGSIQKTGGKFIEIPDRREAIEYSITHAQPGDMIAVIGKGHEDYQEIEGVRYPFLDRQVIEEVVGKKEACPWKE